MNITNCPQPSFPSPILCPPYSPLSSFSTFHPFGQDRTSPEGRSCCGEYNQDGEEIDHHEKERMEEREKTKIIIWPVLKMTRNVSMPRLDRRKRSKCTTNISFLLQINYQSKLQMRNRTRDNCSVVNNNKEANQSSSSHSSCISECLV